MAAPKPVRAARGALTALILILITMGGLLAYGVQEGRAQWTPLLALDLEGGTQMVLSPETDPGEEVDDEQLQQAVEIIRQRVDGTGVAEAEIAVQGSENIVVSLPGTPDQETRELIQAPADMEFRPVLRAETDPTFVDDALLDAQREELSDEEFEEFEAELEAQRESQDEEETEKAVPEDFPEPDAEPQNNSDLNWITQELGAEFANYECQSDISLEQRQAQEPDEPLITCDPERGEKFLLGPVDVDGEYIDDASWGTEQSPGGTSTGSYAVTVHFDSTGTEQFRESSSGSTGSPRARRRTVSESCWTDT